MYSHPHSPRFRYDENGNIILLPERWIVPVVAPEIIETTNDINEWIDDEPREALNAWTIIEEQTQSINMQTRQLAASIIDDASYTGLHNPTSIIHSLIDESREQLAATAQGASDAVNSLRQAGRGIPSHLRGLLLGFSAIARSPIRIGKAPGKKKHHSRFTLFMLDSVRFGATFAAIFLVLFVGINYQSFWQIAKADLALETDTNLEQQLAQITGQASGPQSDTMSAASADVAAGSILSYLPLAGPPDNRLIIPKLGKNVPIIDVSDEELVNADWKGLEKKIQEGLLDGVVHYPGTAKPGQPGDFFLTGHSSYYPTVQSSYKDVFALLYKLEPGDAYSVYYGGDLHTYRVIHKSEVSPSDVSVLDQPSDKRLSTLMTCSPVGTTLRRLIILAEEIDPVTGAQMKVGEKAREEFSPARLDMLPI